MSGSKEGRRVSFQFQENDFNNNHLNNSTEIELEEDPEQELRYRNRSFDGSNSSDSNIQMSSSNSNDIPLRSVTTSSPNYDSGFDSPIYNIRGLPSKSYDSKGYKHNLNNNYLNGSFLSPTSSNNDPEEPTTARERRYFMDGLTTGTAVSFLVTLVIFAAMGFTLLTMFSLKGTRNGKYDSLEYAHAKILERREELNVLIITDEDGNPLSGKKAAIQYHFDSTDPYVLEKIDQFEKEWENLMDVPIVVKDGNEIEPRIDYDVLLDDNDNINDNPQEVNDEDTMRKEVEEGDKDELDPYDLSLYDDGGFFDDELKYRKIWKRSPRRKNPFRYYYNSQQSGSELFRESYAGEPFRFRESLTGESGEPFRRFKKSSDREHFRKN